MEVISYRVIHDSFNVPGLACLENVMVFNNGISFVTVENVSAVKAGYGIRLRYIDERGKRRCVYSYGTVMFFGITEECQTVTLSTGSEVSHSVCGSFVQISAKIAICNNINENVLTN